MERHLRIVRSEEPADRREPQGERGPLVSHDDDACVECLGCVRLCPAKAIRVRDGRPELLAHKCVGCGLCVSECARGAMRVRDDTERVRELLAGTRPVVAILATEFVAAMHPLTPEQLERDLERLGFFSVESTLLGEEIVAEHYEKAHARDNGLFVLRSTCPVAVAWVRRFHPELAPALAPLVPPYVAQARLARELYAEDIAVVYVSPCFARKDEAYDRQFGGAIDACIDFVELRRLLDDARSSAEDVRPVPSRARRRRPYKELSLTDGFPRQTARSLAEEGVEVVRGLRELDRLLRAIERGETGPRIVDMLNCEGCIDGPAVNPGVSVFAKRNIDSTERAASGCARVSTREMLRHLPSVEVRRSFRGEPALAAVTDAARVDAVLAEAGLTRETAPDCGACGYETCVAHAVAVERGDSTWEMCFPLQRRQVAQRVAELAEAAPVDPATGLWSPRVAAERLAEETARAVRYSQPLSLLLIAVDGLESIAARHGESAADDVLAAVAEALRPEVRTADVFGRHESGLSLALPATDKTSAFAVGEKLRERVTGLSVPLKGPGYRERAGRSVSGITLSIGVASAGRSITRPDALLKAAGGALAQSRELGGDQVRLAPG